MIHRAPALADLVRASASIPCLFPGIPVVCDGNECRLTDGGVTDPVPIAFARDILGATHVIVSNCRWLGTIPATKPNTVWIRPRMMSTGTLWSPRGGYGLLHLRAGFEPQNLRWEVAVYVRNLGNQEYITGTANVPIPAFTGRPGEPRHWGTQFTLRR